MAATVVSVNIAGTAFAVSNASYPEITDWNVFYHPNYSNSKPNTTVFLNSNGNKRDRYRVYITSKSGDSNVTYVYVTVNLPDYSFGTLRLSEQDEKNGLKYTLTSFPKPYVEIDISLYREGGTTATIVGKAACT